MTAIFFLHLPLLSSLFFDKLASIKSIRGGRFLGEIEQERREGGLIASCELVCKHHEHRELQYIVRTTELTKSVSFGRMLLPLLHHYGTPSLDGISM